MFVCSVSTVMFNANPLLRYDGYYILSDLTEIPNLRQKATTILSRKLGAWCLGLEEPDDPFLPQRNQAFFAIYTIAAAIYRWVVLFSILWFLYKVLEPYGLKVVSQTLAFVSIGGLVVQPLWSLGKFFYVPGRLDQIKRPRVQISLAVLSAILVFVFAIPLPYRVLCTLEVKPRDAEPVYVEVPGRLESVDVKLGDHVNKKQTLARLSSPDVQLGIAELKGQRDQYQVKLAILRDLVHFRDSAAAEIPQVQESLAAVEEQLQQKEEDEQRLVLTAPADGIVLPPPETPSKPESPGQLLTWSGNPFQPKNLGAYLTDNVLFCQIAKPHEWEAVLVIDQDDLEFVHEGDSVDLKLDELPSRTFSSQIVEIARKDLQFTPRSLSNKSGGDVITKTDESGAERPQNTSYQARAPLDDPEGLLFVGLRGKAKVHAQWQTLASRTWRYLVRTFNFKL